MPTSRKKVAAAAPQMPQAVVLQNVPLHQHTPRPHTVRNANEVHRAEKAATASASGIQAFNQQVAVWLTLYVGTMWTAYGFAAVAVVGLFGVLAILQPGVYTLVAWLSQTFIQLVLLPVIMVGQNVLNHHAELQADEQFKAVQNTLHDAEEMICHLNAQDAELLRQTGMLTQLVQDLTGGKVA